MERLLRFQEAGGTYVASNVQIKNLAGDQRMRLVETPPTILQPILRNRVLGHVSLSRQAPRGCGKAPARNGKAPARNGKRKAEAEAACGILELAHSHSRRHVNGEAGPAEAYGPEVVVVSLEANGTGPAQPHAAAVSPEPRTPPHTPPPQAAQGPVNPPPVRRGRPSRRNNSDDSPLIIRNSRAANPPVGQALFGLGNPNRTPEKRR